MGRLSEVEVHERRDTIIEYCDEQGGQIENMGPRSVKCNLDGDKIKMEFDGSVGIETEFGRGEMEVYGWSDDVRTSNHGEIYFEDLKVDIRQ
jgi:hypothetical protein